MQHINFPSLYLLLLSGTVAAHDNHCAAIADSVDSAGFSDTVNVTCDEEYAVIQSDTFPEHELMTGIHGTNEQVPVPANYAAPVLLSPSLTDNPITRDAALGVAVNGVPIYDYTAGGEMTLEDLSHHQTKHDTYQTRQLDVCGGHAGRGDDYHYHVKPVCMIEQMNNAGNNPIIGWGFDGFPIYGDSNPDGSAIKPGDLDVCNGQPDSVFGYRYHTTADAPYILQCLMGNVPDLKQLPRVRPLTTQNGTGVTPGKPPKGGVDNLVFSQLENGTRSMEYQYKGENYYIRYKPSTTIGCYEFTTRTVTSGGEKKTDVFCR